MTTALTPSAPPEPAPPPPARQRTTIVVWILLFLAGVAGAGLAASTMSEANSYPGLPGWEANDRIAAEYGTGGYERPFVPVVTLPAGVTATAARAEVEAAFEALADHGRVASWTTTGNEVFVSGDGTVVTGLLFPPRGEHGGLGGGGIGEVPDLTPAIVEAMAPHLPPGSSVEVTGLDLLAPGADHGGIDVLTKSVVCAIAALLILLLVFRSWIAVLPVLAALVAITVAYLPLGVVALFTPVHENAVQMVPLLGLGVAIDYALVTLMRWRDARRGVECDTHPARRAVLWSATAVVLGLLTLFVVPIPMLRNLGFAGASVAAAGAAVSISLLPLLLRKVRAKARPESSEHQGRWEGFARSIVKHRVATTVLTGAVLVALAVPAWWINLTVPTSDNLSGQAGAPGLARLEAAGFGSGMLSSYDVYTPAAQQVAAVEAISSTDGVTAVVTGSDRAWSNGSSAMLTVVPADESGTAAGQAAIDAVRAAVPDGVLVGGSAAQTLDYVSVAYGWLPLVLVIVALVTFVILARALRSLVLAVKAIVLNLVSLAAVIGAMVLMWQWGFGTEWLFGLEATGVLGTFVPITILAFLSGLSMDYELFLLSRMREEYDRTGSTTAAVARGLGRMARLITAAAAILILSFGALAFGGEYDVAVFASGMALGILIDAILVRCLLVPATVALMGRWNWWLPPWAARLLRTEPAPLPAKGT